MQRLPATCGGYELIFPTTPLTEKLAGCVGGDDRSPPPEPNPQPLALTLT